MSSQLAWAKQCILENGYDATACKCAVKSGTDTHLPTDRVAQQQHGPIRLHSVFDVCTLAWLNASRPACSTSTCCMAGACTGANKAWAAAKPRCSDSVMRSNKGSPRACHLSFDGAGPPLKTNWYSVTRSMRCSGKPQLRAMSVALDAQGETVPKRGLTTKLGCAVAGQCRAGPSKRCTAEWVSASSACSVATKYTWRACKSCK